MNGQWVGDLTGSNPGLAVLELDEELDHFSGVAYFFDANLALPSVVAVIRTPDKSAKQSFKVPLMPFDPRSGMLVATNQLDAIYPGVTISNEAVLKIRQKGNSLAVNWKTENETSGAGTLTRRDLRSKSDVPVENESVSWEEFKTYVNRLPVGQFIFRGQPNQHRLSTAFHRTKRSSLVRYINRDIPVMYRQLSPSFRHVFDLAQPAQNAAFYNLLQHHGYPTPLLDWTYSPYIAAFFALRTPPRSGRLVRVYMFDAGSWVANYPQISRLAYAHPHFSILEPLGIDNPRMVPQQALLTITNVADIETYLHAREVQAKKRFLFALDIDSKDRIPILQDLTSMGLTAGSLFPGLDGTCEEMKNRMFGY